MMLHIWLSTAPSGHCRLDSTSVPFTNKFETGVSVASDFPKNLHYRMSDLFPDDLLLSDNFKVSGKIIVSGSLKEYLIKALPGHSIEFLPVSILNHKGRIASVDYFIMHLLGLVDCIDIKKSKVTWNPLNKKIIMECESLVIDEAKVPSNVKVFRPMHWGNKTIVQSGFSKELKAAGFTGLRFKPATDFTGIG